MLASTSLRVLMLAVVLAAALFGSILWPTTRNEGTQAIPDYQTVTAAELSAMLGAKDFTLIDVHIPEQEHILSTDAVIPYNETEQLAAALPDKNAKIVLYCRSGTMSKTAAADLAALGYTNVFHLDGGVNAWRALGYPVRSQIRL